MRVSSIARERHARGTELPGNVAPRLQQIIDCLNGDSAEQAYKAGVLSSAQTQTQIKNAPNATPTPATISSVETLAVVTKYAAPARATAVTA